MRIAIISAEGGLEWAIKLTVQGHEVGTWIKDPKCQTIGLGMVRRFHDVQDLIDWNPDLAFTDVNYLTFYADQVRSAGIPVFGGYKANDLLEKDRFGAIKFAFKHGVTVPVTVDFKEKEIKEAGAFVDKHQDRHWVLKSSRKDKASSFVATHSEDLVPFLQQFPPKGPFILQERIDGTEINHEVWFANGEPFLFVGGMEQKKFLPGNKARPKGLGANTGCMSSFSWYVDHTELLFKIFTPKLLDKFKQLKMNGPVDMAVIVDKHKTPHFLEFTPRFGYYSIHDTWEFIDTDWGEFILAMALGKKPQFRWKAGFGFSVGVSIPPYPQDNTRLNIIGEKIEINDKMKGNFWPDDVAIKDGKLITAGTSGHLGVITAFGKTWREAQRLGMERADSFKMSDVQYRVDAGEQGRNIDELNRMGIMVP